MRYRSKIERTDERDGKFKIYSFEALIARYREKKKKERERVIEKRGALVNCTMPALSALSFFYFSIGRQFIHTGLLFEPPVFAYANIQQAVILSRELDPAESNCIASCRGWSGGSVSAAWYWKFTMRTFSGHGISTWPLNREIGRKLRLSFIFFFFSLLLLLLPFLFISCRFSIKGTSIKCDGGKKEKYRVERVLIIFLFVIFPLIIFFSTLFPLRVRK